MSSSDSIETLKARFERQKINSADTHDVQKQKLSPPLASKVAIFDGSSQTGASTKSSSPRTGGGGSPKLVSKQQAKKLDMALSKKPKTPPGRSPPTPNQKTVAPILGKSKNIRDGWISKAGAEGEASSSVSGKITDASSALASVLQGRPPKEEEARNGGGAVVTKRLLTPLGKSKKDRANSMEVKKFSSVSEEWRFSGSIGSSSVSDDECLLVSRSPGETPAREEGGVQADEHGVSVGDDEVCLLKPEDPEETCRLPVYWTNNKGGSNGVKTAGSNWKGKEKVVSQTCDAVVSQNREGQSKKPLPLPLPSPPSPSSPSSATHTISSPPVKPRSASDLTESESHDKTASVKEPPTRIGDGKKPLPPPKKLSHLSPEHTISKSRPTSDPTDKPKPGVGGAKPSSNKVKPNVSNTKPALPTKPPTRAKPGLPLGKPVVSSTKPNVSGKKYAKRLPPPPPPPSKLLKRNLSPDSQPTLGTPNSSSVSREELSNGKEVYKEEEEDCGKESRESSSSTKELDATLTMSQSCDLDLQSPDSSHDLEDTLMKDSEPGDWVLVAEKSPKEVPSLQKATDSELSPKNKEREKNSSPSMSPKVEKRLPSKATESSPKSEKNSFPSMSPKVEKKLPFKATTESSPKSEKNSFPSMSPKVEKKLPFKATDNLQSSPKSRNIVPPLLPLKKNERSPNPVPDTSIGSDSETPKLANKVSSLRDMFSSPSSAPPPPPSINYAKEPPKSPGLEGTRGAVGGSNSPSSPLIRVTPGSYSGPKIGGTNKQGPPPEAESSNRGNVDSGFISEAPDDLNLVRRLSVESLPGSPPSEERGGVVSPLPLSPEVNEVVEADLEPEPVPEPEPEPEIWDEARIEKARNKRLNIAKELLETEKTYCSRIKVVAVGFYDVIQQYNLKSKQLIPELAVHQIFLNIRQIHTLSENILSELQERMDNWNTHEALGDVICRLAPFLKLYAFFTAGFEDAIKTLTECTKKDRKFDAVVRDYERTSISTGLGLASYMLEPVQRIPRYRLLLLDYLKYLPPDSSDRSDTESALRIISEAADHSNERIKELENSNEVLSIQRRVVDYEGSLLAPSRSFIMGGPLQKFSRKTLTQRYFFLFSDILLHTYPPEKDVYKFRNEMPIFGMKVEDPKVSLTPHSINIYSTTRSLILVASSDVEKRSWINALQSVINQDLKKRSSLRRDTHLLVDTADNLFGTKAPIMVPDKSVTMCQSCSAEFTFTFRRHHCRACGKVVCGNCSQQKCYLPYLSKMERVCELCIMESKNPDRMSGDEGTDSPLPSPVGSRKDSSLVNTGSGVLNLKAYDEEDAVIAGYVLALEGKKWNKMWYQIKRDCVLYKFKAHEDIKAIHSMPLPGYALGTDQAQHIITLNHHSGMKNLRDTFRVDDQASFENWIEAIRKVIRMEFDSIGVQPTISPLVRDSRSFSESTEQPLSRPLSQHSRSNSRPNSFNSDSRPSSLRERSPDCDSFESSESFS